MGFLDKISDKVADKVSNKVGEKIEQKWIQKAVAKANAPKKDGKMYITYTLEEPLDLYEGGEILKGKMFLESTNKKTKKLKFVKARISENWMYKKSRTEIEPQFNFLNEVELDKKATIEPGETKEYDFEIQFPKGVSPRTGKKISDWSLALNFIQKSGIKASLGARKITASYPIIIEGTPDVNVFRRDALVKEGIIPAPSGWVDGAEKKKEKQGGSMLKKAALGAAKAVAGMTSEKLGGIVEDLTGSEDMGETIETVGKSVSKIAIEEIEKPKAEIVRENEERAKELRVLSRELTPIEKIEEWIRSDKKFLKLIDQVIVSGTNKVEVKFDLNTEGYLEEIATRLVYSDVQGSKYIIKLENKAFMDVPYHTNVIMGKTREGVVSATYEGSLANDRDMYESLKEVDDRNRPMDTLALMLYQNTALRKMVSSLKMKSPDSAHVSDVRIPVTIEPKGEEGCIITVNTFFDKSISPFDLYVRVMDGLAESLDQILDLEPEKREEAPMADKEWFEIKKPSIEPQFSSKYLEKRETSLADIPTCPHCDRPLPRAQSTDYRRCPFCYEKLD